MVEDYGAHEYGGGDEVDDDDPPQRLAVVPHQDREQDEGRILRPGGGGGRAQALRPQARCPTASWMSRRTPGCRGNVMCPPWYHSMRGSSQWRQRSRT